MIDSLGSGASVEGKYGRCACALDDLASYWPADGKLTFTD